MSDAVVDQKHLDSRLPLQERVDALVAQMTLREKIAQMLHSAPPIPRLSVPAYNWWNECLHGVARAGKATVFPQAIGMAAAFNEPLLFKAASAISDEARAKHHEALRVNNRQIYFGLTFWTPNINIFRDPRWGRGQETYGEDPYLTARLGVAFVTGLQGNDAKHRKLVATAKHYAVHSGPEADRHRFDAVVSQRDLRETYLPAFKACVCEGEVASIMGAYNRTNGEPCNGSPTLLQKILRGEWGFDGYVVSDCWALKDFHEGHKVTNTPAESVALAVKTGCDLNCGDLYRNLLAAVEQGLCTEADIDVCVKRLFRARFQLGMFDPSDEVVYAAIPPSVVNCAKHRKLTLQRARESLVLLKNSNGRLPLRKDLASILVVGPCVMDEVVLLGNYNGFAPEMTTFVEGILKQAAPGTQVNVSRGCDLSSDRPIRSGELAWMLPDADVVVAVLGYTADLEGEEGCTDGGGDRVRYGLPGRQQELLEHLHKSGKPIVLVVHAGSPVDLTWAEQNVDAILMAWYPGEAGGEAVAEALFGQYNPAGRLPITFPKSYEQLPAFEDYNMTGRTYRFMTEEPLYRFGYGLSYSKFEYRNLKLSKAAVGIGEDVTVKVEVSNVSYCAGDEVVQLYVSDVDASVPVPRQHLEGFSRIHLKPGETRTVIFDLEAEKLACYDDAGQPFQEPGEFCISIGGGQPDDPAGRAISATLTVE